MNAIEQRMVFPSAEIGRNPTMRVMPVVTSPTLPIPLIENLSEYLSDKLKLKPKDSLLRKFIMLNWLGDHKRHKRKHPRSRLKKRIIAGLSKTGAAIMEHEANFGALHVIYNELELSDNAFSRYLDRFWLNILNARAVYNRRVFIEEMAKEMIQYLWQLPHIRKRGYVHLASLACASLEGIIPAIQWAESNGIRVICVLMDNNKEAFKKALELAKQHPIEGSNGRTVVDSIVGVVVDLTHPAEIDLTELHLSIGGESKGAMKFDGIEIVGLIEYYQTRSAIGMFEVLFNWLTPGGVMLTSNIQSNPEQDFVHNIVGWRPMRYRTEDDLTYIVTQAGFPSKLQQQCVEPCLVHRLVWATKPMSEFN